MKKKRATRIAILFFSVMILLTFFSRTIYRAMLPNVQIAGLNGGLLKYAHTAYDIRIKGQDSVSVQLPVLLSRPLTVKKLHVKPNQHVKKGEALLSFHEADGEYLMEEAEQRLDTASVTLSLWERDRERRIVGLESAIKRTSRKADKAMMEEDLALLVSGIMNGMTKRQMTADVTVWEKNLSSLNRLKLSGWRLRCVESGLIESILIKEGDRYSGLDPLLTLCPEGTGYRIGCVWESAPALRLNEWIIQARITGFSAVDAMDIDISDGRATLWFPTPEGVPDPEKIASVSINAESPYNPIIINSKTIHDGVVFRLKSKTGAWGQTEYYAEELQITAGLKDTEHTAVLSGLSYNDVLIVSSNKPLENGQTVLLDSYE